jgi:hypothetical protein
MRKVIFGGATRLDNYLAREDTENWLLWNDEAAAAMAEFWQGTDGIATPRGINRPVCHWTFNERSIKDCRTGSAPGDHHDGCNNLVIGEPACIEPRVGSFLAYGE